MTNRSPLMDLWAWRSDANAPAPNLLAPQGPRPEMRPGPTPTLRDRVFDYIYGALGGTPSQRSTASALTDLADFATLGVPTSLDQGVRDVADGKGTFSLAMALVPGAKLGKAAGTAAGRAAKAVLPMDADARMARLTEQGYRPGYHGTATTEGQIFQEFQLPKGVGPVSGSQVAPLGVSVSIRPEIANEFASLAAKKKGGDPAVLPLMWRSDRRAVLSLDGTEKDKEVAATISDAFATGYDAVVLRNYPGPGGASGQDVVIVKNPNQLRSPHAAFDPAKKDSANLFASFAGAAGLGGYGLSSGQSSDRYPDR